MTLLQFSKDRLRAITVGKVSDKKDDEPSETVDRVYPIATAVADGIVTQLHKMIDDLRADRDAWREQAQRLAPRRWWSW
jgi:hypothetical protein